MYVYARHPYVGAIYAETRRSSVWGVQKHTGELTVYVGRLEVVLTRAKRVREEMGATRPRRGTVLALALGLIAALIAGPALA